MVQHRVGYLVWGGDGRQGKVGNMRLEFKSERKESSTKSENLKDKRPGKDPRNFRTSRKELLAEKWESEVSGC